MVKLSTAFVMLASAAALPLSAKVFAADKVTEKRALAPFEKLSLTGAITLTVNVGPAQSIEITSDAETLKNLKTTVDDKELSVSCESHAGPFSWNRHCQPATIVVTVPMLSRLEITGSVDDSKITGLKGANFELEVAGTTDLSLSGQIEELSADISGSGTVYAKDLVTKRATIDVSGSGKFEIFASESIEADISGSGKIHYAGQPGKVKTSIAGSGQIEKL